MASAPAYLLILFSLPFLAAAQGSDPVDILKKSGQFSTLLDLLSKTNLVGEIANKLNNTDGITILAPTNDAFQRVNATLERLTADEKRKILAYHALLKYVSFSDLVTVSNPVSTLASEWTLNFTGGNGQVNVSTGVVNTKVGYPLYDKSPLGIFPIEDVLIPPQFAASAPAAPPQTATVLGPSAPSPKSASSLERRVELGAIVGAVFACLSFF